MVESKLGGDMSGGLTDQVVSQYRKPMSLTEQVQRVVDSIKGAKTEDHDYDLTQIPLTAEIRIGRIFKEGERVYGRDNWRKGGGDKAFQLKRANKALKHLKMYIHRLQYGVDHPEHEPGEDDLAKVGWYTVIQMEIECLEALNGEDQGK